MIIDVLTLFPQMFAALNASIMGKAQKKRQLDLRIHNLRDYTSDKHRTVDDYPFGGEAGMVLKPEPLACAIETIKRQGPTHVIFMTPQGRVFSQKCAIKLAKKENILIICGHYKGIDERIRQKYVDEEISIGDFVLTGGEIPAMCIVDSVVRLLSGVLNDRESLETDSFFKNRLGWPVYTRPEVFEEMKVPEVLLTGHHKNIEQWRRKTGLKRTLKNRPDLIEKEALTKSETQLLKNE